jgi:ketosteroid isomerase-like protein
MSVLAVGLLFVALVPPLYRATVRLMLRRNIASYQAGDPAPLLATMASDVHFVFPGESSWKADVHSREEVARWERRFLEAGLRLEPQEILVSGPPWNTKIALHFTDELTTPAGDRIYDNAGVIFGTARWGKLTEFVVYEDTQKLGPLDEYLLQHPARAH